jgi:hypothetical protein
MSDKRRAALAIGVSDATPLPYLAGAINGARAFHAWAQALGYESHLVTDDVEPVTATRLRSELEALLAGGPLHRLILYFAGHGLIREAEEGLWLLSDWNKDLRAVAVEVLRRRLYRYEVDQIAIFADACRSLATDIETADLTPDGLLGKGPGARSGTVVIDKYIAAQDGTKTYVIPSGDPEDDRGLFSGVLLEGLWGTKPTAFSSLKPGKVTSESLASYLETAVPEIAQRYRITLMPSVSATFRHPDDVYFGDGPAVTPPAFPPWPAPTELLAPKPDRAVRGGRIGLGPQPRPGQELEDRVRNQERPDAFETRAGFAVEGDAVVAMWTAAGVVAESHLQPNWWRVRPANQVVLQHPTPVLIELASGRFAAVAALPDFIGSIVATEDGVAALVYREVDSPPDAARSTEEAIGLLEAGGLHADDATDLAVDLRQEEHVDPVRGVLSAYLYDSVGDVDSIRRMAHYYARHHQAIPYDVALLADLEGTLRDGILWATVPAVSERDPRTEKEREARWTYAATTEVRGPVGGLWPWLRQGWAFLDDPAPDGSTLVLPGMLEVTDDLTKARFTTLHHSGGVRLAEAFGLSVPNAIGGG